MSRLVTVVRWALGLLFLYAAASKLADLRAFAEEVANYRALPAVQGCRFVLGNLGNGAPNSRRNRHCRHSHRRVH